MGDRSKIEWTDATWNPIRARRTDTSGLVGWHCEHVTGACKNCYAERWNKARGTGLPFKPGHLANDDVAVFLDPVMLVRPIRWARARWIFPCSMTDLFAAFVATADIARCLAVMALTPQHTYQVLTKRSDRMCKLFSDPMFVAMVEHYMRELAPAPPHPWAHLRELADVGGWPLKNVLVGTSVGDDVDGETTLPLLIDVPARRRFISYEPALGPLEPLPYILRSVHWVIAGGESGPAARPPHPGWFRGLRDRCRVADVPFFFKQWGEWEPREQWSGHLGGGRFERMCAIMPDGSECPPDVVPQDVGAHRMARVGKKLAGALLDGVEHREMPRAIV